MFRLTKADSLTDSAASLAVLIADEPRIRLHAPATAQPLYRHPAATSPASCPDAREQNSRLSARLQKQELLVNSIDVSAGSLPPPASCNRAWAPTRWLHT